MNDVDFLINDDGTQSQNNPTGIDLEGKGLGHSDDMTTDDTTDWGASDDDFSSSDDW